VEAIAGKASTAILVDGGSANDIFDRQNCSTMRLEGVMTPAQGITFLATLGLIGVAVVPVDTQETARGERWHIVKSGEYSTVMCST
jgi:hypothetical protein